LSAAAKDAEGVKVEAGKKAKADEKAAKAAEELETVEKAEAAKVVSEDKATADATLQHEDEVIAGTSDKAKTEAEVKPSDDDVVAHEFETKKLANEEQRSTEAGVEVVKTNAHLANGSSRPVTSRLQRRK
jgi:hypothetical protein